MIAPIVWRAQQSILRVDSWAERIQGDQPLLSGLPGLARGGRVEQKGEQRRCPHRQPCRPPRRRRHHRRRRMCLGASAAFCRWSSAAHAVVGLGRRVSGVTGVNGW